MGGKKKKGKAKCPLQLGDLVLAKVKGYPAWPAKVSNPEDWDKQPDQRKLFVEFFGTGEIAFVAPADIQLFTEETKNRLLSRQNKKSKTFVQALEEICEEFDEQNENSPVLNSDFENEESENEEFQSENEEVKSGNEELKSENVELKSDNVALESEIGILKSENRALESEKEELKSEKEELKSEKEELKSENEDLKSENEVLELEKEELESEENLKRKKSDELESEEKLKSKKSDELKSEEKLKSKKSDELESEENLKRKKSDELESKEKLKSKKSDELESEEKLKNKKSDELESEKKLKSKKSDELKESISALRKERIINHASFKPKDINNRKLSVENDSLKPKKDKNDDSAEKLDTETEVKKRPRSPKSVKKQSDEREICREDLIRVKRTKRESDEKEICYSSAAQRRAEKRSVQIEQKVEPRVEKQSSFRKDRPKSEHNKDEKPNPKMLTQAKSKIDRPVEVKKSPQKEKALEVKKSQIEAKKPQVSLAKTSVHNSKELVKEKKKTVIKQEESKPKIKPQPPENRSSTNFSAERIIEKDFTLEERDNSMKHLIAVAQAVRKQVHSIGASSGISIPQHLSMPHGFNETSSSSLQFFPVVPLRNSAPLEPSPVKQAELENLNHPSPVFRLAGAGSVSSESEALAAKELFEASVESLTRTKESIGRASKMAIECAKFGLANEIMELVFHKLEIESSFHRRVDLFFLVDSITQSAHAQKGFSGGSFIGIVQSSLRRILTNAAPAGPAGRENRRQCLKVLRLWLERKIMPEALTRKWINELKGTGDDLITDVSSLRAPTRAERNIDDPIRELDDDFLVDEYGSNATIDMPSFLKSPISADDEDFQIILTNGNTHDTKENISTLSQTPDRERCSTPIADSQCQNLNTSMDPVPHLEDHHHHHHKTHDPSNNTALESVLEDHHRCIPPSNTASESALHHNESEPKTEDDHTTRESKMEDRSAWESKMEDRNASESVLDDNNSWESKMEDEPEPPLPLPPPPSDSPPAPPPLPPPSPPPPPPELEELPTQLPQLHSSSQLQSSSQLHSSSQLQSSSQLRSSSQLQSSSSQSLVPQMQQQSSQSPLQPMQVQESMQGSEQQQIQPPLPPGPPPMAQQMSGQHQMPMPYFMNQNGPGNCAIQPPNFAPNGPCNTGPVGYGQNNMYLPPGPGPASNYPFQQGNMYQGPPQMAPPNQQQFNFGPCNFPPFQGPGPYPHDGFHGPGPYPHDGFHGPGPYPPDGFHGPGPFPDGSHGPGPFPPDGFHGPGPFLPDGCNGPGPYPPDGYFRPNMERPPFNPMMGHQHSMHGPTMQPGPPPDHFNPQMVPPCRSDIPSFDWRPS